jgi:hypothetical protein
MNYTPPTKPMGDRYCTSPNRSDKKYALLQWDVMQVDEVGCISHSKAREYLMEDIIGNLKNKIAVSKRHKLGLEKGIGRNIFYDGIERGYEDAMSIIINGVSFNKKDICGHNNKNNLFTRETPPEVLVESAKRRMLRSGR